MTILPKAIRSYFEAMEFGLEGLLPVCRIENRLLLKSLHEALEREFDLTVQDLEHLKTILGMTDRIVFPQIKDIQSLCEVESFLMQANLAYTNKQISLAMRWLFLLFARHGRVEADLEKADEWLRVWRKVQVFEPKEKAFLSDAIDWMVSKNFQSNTVQGIVREYYKFFKWMRAKCLDSIGQIGNLELQRYLLERAKGYKNSSKAKFLSGLRPIFYYYKEAVNGSFQVPDYTVKTVNTLGLSASASSEEIETLEKALLENRLPGMAGLMLILILGYGLSLKSLPLLELAWEPGVLKYTERLPCRRGSKEREIRLDLSQSWLSAYWHNWLKARDSRSTYLFTSCHGQKRLRPVSAEYSQRAVKAAVELILGYSIPVNHLERGAVKRLAKLSSLTRFMMLTDSLSKSRLNRMMYWLVNK